MTLGNWLARHAQNAVGALGTLTRNPIGTAMTVAVIGIALALPAALNSLVQAGRAVAGNWEEVRDFSVYLAPDAPLARAQELAQELGKADGVASVRVITADTGCSLCSKNRRSRRVRMPSRCPSGRVMGTPDTLCLRMTCCACATLAFGGSVTGSLMMPLALRLTLSTSSVCSSIDMFL